MHHPPVYPSMHHPSIFACIMYPCIICPSIHLCMHHPSIPPNTDIAWVGNLKTKQRASMDTLHETRSTEYEIKARLLPKYREVTGFREGVPMLNLKGSEESHRQEEGQSRSRQASRLVSRFVSQGRQLGLRSPNKREPTESEEGHGGRPGLGRKSSATEDWGQTRGAGSKGRNQMDIEAKCTNTSEDPGRLWEATLWKWVLGTQQRSHLGALCPGPTPLGKALDLGQQHQP